MVSIMSGWRGVDLKISDTDVNDNFPRSIYDGMDGCLREEFSRGEEGSSRV